MSLPEAITKLQQDILDLESERDSLYLRNIELVSLISNYKTLLDAFKLVSTSPSLYDKWVSTLQGTPRPVEEEPPVSNP